MTTQDMNEYKQRLLALIGTDNFEREFVLRWRHNRAMTLDRIDKALQRMNDGTFGTCEECPLRQTGRDICLLMCGPRRRGGRP